MWHGLMARRHRRGANALEFALGAPILIALCFGIVEFGWLYRHKSILLETARAATIDASRTDPDFADPVASARTIAEEMLVANGLDLGNAEITIGTSDIAQGRLCTVDIQYQFTGLTGAVPMPAVLGANATRMMENPE